MRGNLQSSLKRRPSSMAEYDRLPPELRAWLAQAALPWSVRSVRKLWSQARATDDALGYLTAVERRALARDAPVIWGPTPPHCPLGEQR